MLLAVITPHGPFQHAFWLATLLDPLPGCVCVYVHSYRTPTPAYGVQTRKSNCSQMRAYR